MAEMLLINPRRRRRRAAIRRRRRNPVAAVSRRRRRNPMPLQLAARKRTTLRRANPIGAVRRTLRRRVMRRRNPIGGNYAQMLMTGIREAFIGGAGSIAVDLAMGQINKVLPANLRVVPGAIGAGDAIKAVVTVLLGHFLAGPTRGLSRKMAQGALTVQTANLMKGFLPATLTSQMGYFSPAVTTYGVPTLSQQGMGAYTRGTPLLSAYQRPDGPTPLLNRARTSARGREMGYVYRT